MTYLSDAIHFVDSNKGLIYAMMKDNHVNANDVDDFLQESYLAVAEALEKNDGIIKTSIIRMAIKHRWWNWKYKNNFIMVANWRNWKDIAAIECVEDCEESETDFVDEHGIFEFICKYPKVTQQIFELHYVYGISFKLIAKSLKIPYKDVVSTHRKTLESLRKELSYDGK